MKKIYIAGPMRGIKDYNFPAFHEADQLLTLHGYLTINPAEIDEREGFSTKTPQSKLTREDLEKFIVRDIHLVMSADAVCVLDGWENSKGVAVEITVADYCNIPIYNLEGALQQEVDIDK